MARRRRPEAQETSWWSQQSDVVKGGIIGVVGIIITAIVAPILLPIVGTIITPPTATPIVPTSTATQPPLGQPGLYLTRTINPPISLGAGESVLTSVWIQSVGGKSYTIDSIADLGDAMCLMSSGSGFSGAVLPSAIYKYDLGELRHILTPLSPSLQLSPLDPTELSFTLDWPFQRMGIVLLIL